MQEKASGASNNGSVDLKHWVPTPMSAVDVSVLLFSFSLVLLLNCEGAEKIPLLFCPQTARSQGCVKRKNVGGISCVN